MMRGEFSALSPPQAPHHLWVINTCAQLNLNEEIVTSYIACRKEKPSNGILFYTYMHVCVVLPIYPLQNESA